MKKDKIKLCIDALAADVADAIAREKNIGVTDALREFMQTKTYNLLFNAESLLYLETTEYIYDMYLAEQTGDWERWREE